MFSGQEVKNLAFGHFPCTMGTCALFSRHIIEAKFLLEATGLSKLDKNVKSVQNQEKLFNSRGEVKNLAFGHFPCTMGTCGLFSRHIIEAKFLLEATGLIAAASTTWIKCQKVFKIREIDNMHS